MFQFPGCPTHPYVFWMGYAGIPQHGFPHSDVSGSSRLHTPDRSFSQCPTSFFGTDCQGILHTPLLAFSNVVKTHVRYGELVLLANGLNRSLIRRSSLYGFY